MQYDPIKKSLGIFFNKSVILRKLFYSLLDLLLLRTWHVKKALGEVAPKFPKAAFVLDAGSGFGQYSWRMSSRYSQWEIKAIDIKQEQIDDCRDFFNRTGRAGRVKFELADLVEFNEKNKYDLILSVDVMEHIDDDMRVFQNLHNALKSEGILLISTPSDRGGSDVHDSHGKSFIEEHVRDGYNIDDIQNKLRTAGFHKISAKYTYGPAGQLSWLLSMKIPVKMLNASYAFFLILPFYYILAFPVSLVFNTIDLYSGNKSGTGLLVEAEK